VTLCHPPAGCFILRAGAVLTEMVLAGMQLAAWQASQVAG